MPTVLSFRTDQARKDLEDIFTFLNKPKAKTKPENGAYLTVAHRLRIIALWQEQKYSDAREVFENLIKLDESYKLTENRPKDIIRAALQNRDKTPIVSYFIFWGKYSRNSQALSNLLECPKIASWKHRFFEGRSLNHFHSDIFLRKKPDLLFLASTEYPEMVWQTSLHRRNWRIGRVRGENRRSCG